MRAPRFFFAFAVVAVLLCLTGEVWCEDYQEFKFSTGFDYSSGDYGGSSDTDILYVPFTGKYMTSKYAIKMTVPYLRITSDELVVTSGGEVIGTSQGLLQTDRNTESGMGDIVTTFSYYLFEEAGERPMVDLNAKIKFGTADEEKGLGTGENDFAFDVDLVKTKGSAAYFGTLGYKLYGDPALINFNDVFYFNLGFSYRVNTKTSGGLMYDFREKTTENGNSLSEFTPFLTYRINKDYKLMGYLVAGLADGSPDYGIGFTVSRLFGLDEIKQSYKYVEKFRFW